MQQNAFLKNDSYVTLKKQKLMLEVILNLYEKFKQMLKEEVSFATLKNSEVLTNIHKLKYETTNEDLSMFLEYNKQIDDFFQSSIKK